MFRQNRAAINLVLLDAVMPNKSGCEVLARIRAESPDTKVVFASGYAPETALAGMELGEEVRLITKPFDTVTLLRTVREALEDSKTWPVPA